MGRTHVRVHGTVPRERPAHDRRVPHPPEDDRLSPQGVAHTLTRRHRELVLAGGRPEDLLDLTTAIDRAVHRFPVRPDLRLLAATVALALQRPDLADAALDAVPGLADRPAGRVLAADAAQLLGDYRAAERHYRTALRQAPRWSTTARLAALSAATGRFADADDLYATAETEIPAGHARSFAWLRVQRGALALALGRLRRAGRFLTDAELAHGGWWYVTAHRAALNAAHGRPVDAAAGYRSVLAEVDRPDLREALGTVLAAAGEADAAADCHATALAAYTRSVARGEVHYLHHLATFHVDVHPHFPAALAWAQEDAALRRNGRTLSLLAECQHRVGRTAEARATLDEAFARGAGDPQLQARARAIRGSGR